MEINSCLNSETNIYKNNIKKILNYSFKNYSNNSLLGTRTKKGYKWKNYKQIENEIENITNYFSNSLLSQDSIFTEYICNEGEETNNLIGIFSKPCEEALISLLSLHSLSNITVLPIFDNIKSEDLIFILSETKVKTLIIDKDCLNQLIKVLNNYNKVIHYNIDLEKNTSMKAFISNLILINNDNSFDSKDKDIFSSIRIIKFSDMLECNTNRNYADDIHSSSYSKIVFLNYTSQSLKGVLISESSLINTYNNFTKLFKSDEVYFSITSLADLPEYLNLLSIISKGGAIGFYSGNYTNIFEDMQFLKPTVLYSFPIILIKIFDALQFTIKKLDEAKKILIENAIRSKMEHLNNEGSLNHHLWDKLFFNKIKNIIGGKVKLILIGGGSIKIHIVQFLKLCLSTNIKELYGMTETCGVVSFFENLSNDFQSKLVDGIELKVIKNNRIGYFTEKNIKNSGELCLKGKNLFSRYFNNNMRCFDEEGWFHTGDYVVIYESLNDDTIDNLKFIDRIDNFFKTKQGSWVTPNLLEGYYINCDLISHITIIQDEESDLIGVVSLNKIKSFESLKFNKKRKLSNNDNISTRKYSVESLNNINNSGSKMYRTDKRDKLDESKKLKNSTSIKENDENGSSNITISNNICTDNDDEYTDCALSNYSCNLDYDTLIIKPNENENLKDNIFQSLEAIWSNLKLKKYEMIDKIFILEKDFVLNVENGMLTSKFGLRRKLLNEVYNTYLKKLSNS